MLLGIVIAIAAMSPSPASCPSTKWCWRRSQRCSWRGRRWSWSWDEMRCDVKSWLWCEHWCILSFFTLWSLFDKDLLISLLLCCVIEVIKPMWYELGVRVFYIRSVSPLIVRWEKWQLWSACNAKCNFRFFRIPNKSGFEFAENDFSSVIRPIESEQHSCFVQIININFRVHFVIGWN